MRSCRPVLVALVALVVSPIALRAADTHEPFLRALRARGYYDTAFDYLDELARRGDLSDEMRTSIEFEKGITLLQSAQSAAADELRAGRTDEALDLLEEFARSHPRHPLAARANYRRGQALLDLATIAVSEAAGLPDEPERSKALEGARDKIGAARGVLQSAHDALKTAYEGFDVYIPQGETEKRAARAGVEADYLWAQLDLAKADFHDATTYDPQSDEAKTLLARATERFLSIHEKYRQQLIGHIAHEWLGQCFQQQGEIGKALGIYDELLRNPSDSPDVVRLKNDVELHRLRCLIHDKRKDYTLAVTEAKSWLAADPRRARQDVGLGVRRELALAYEKLAATAGLSQDEKNRYLRMALDESREIGKFPGRYKNEANRMVARFESALGRKPGVPGNFQAAYALAQTRLEEISNLKSRLDAAPRNSAERARMQDELDRQLREGERLFRIALELADSSTSPVELNGARHYLAYIYHVMGSNYEAAVLADYVGRHARTADPAKAADAAYLAMHAYLQLYHDAPSDGRGFEEERVVNACNILMTEFSESVHANEARVTLADLYRLQGNPVEAVKVLAAVPESSEYWPQAQIAAGQTLWLAHENVNDIPAERKPSPEERDRWAADAKAHVQAGIARLAERTSIDAAAREKLISGRTTLAAILIDEGEYQKALDLLAGPSDPILGAVSIAQGETRPDEGVRSESFAAYAYYLLLRCYVGLQQIDEALRAMKEFEAVAGDNSADGRTYKQLGDQLEQEMQRLSDAGDRTRLQELRASYEQFLGSLFDRRDQMAYPVLVWMAGAYTGLGEGANPSQPPAAADSFARAAQIYRLCLQHADAPPGNDMALKLRLVTSLRRQGDFEGASKLVDEMIVQKPQWLDLQVEAASLYEEWGASGDGSNYQKIIVAIDGNGAPGSRGTIWGWNRIADDFQRSLNARVLSDEKRTEYQDRYRDARLRSAAARRQYGLTHPDRAKGKESLDATRRELESFALLTPGVDGATKQRFNDLYGKVLADLNLKKADLAWTSAAPTVAQVDPAADKAAADEPKQAPHPEPKTSKAASAPSAPTADGESPTGGNDTLLVLAVVLITVGGLAGFTFLMLRNTRSRRSRRRTISASASTSPPPVPGVPPVAAAASQGSARRSKQSSDAVRRRRGTEGGAPPPPAAVKRPPRPGGPPQQ